MKKISYIVISIILVIMSGSLFTKTTQEEKFWKWFALQNETYYQSVDNLEIRDKLFNELSEKLKKIHPDIVFEFSPIHENGTREFTISADGLKEVFPFVEKLVAAAPKMEKWQINAFRQRVPGENLEINFGDFSIEYSDIYFRYADDNDKLGIELNIRDFDDSANSKNAIYILLDGLIGEYDMETKISWIDWKKLDESKVDSLYQLIELRQIVDNKKE